MCRSAWHSIYWQRDVFAARRRACVVQRIAGRYCRDSDLDELVTDISKGIAPKDSADKILSMAEEAVELLLKQPTTVSGKPP